MLRFKIGRVDPEDICSSSGEIVFVQIRECQPEVVHAAYPANLEAADFLAFNAEPVQIQEPIDYENLIGFDFVVFGWLSRFAVADADAPAVDGGLKQVVDDSLLP